MSNLVRSPAHRLGPLVDSPARPLAPAKTLRDLVRNCDPDVPLPNDDPRWQDFSLARGDQAMAALEKELSWRPEGQFVHATFVSHRGAGKSTEILRLTERLSNEYEPVYIEATVEMDPFRIEAEDLLLNMALAVEERMRERGTPLPADLLKRVTGWFDEVVRTTRWAQNYNAEAAAGVELKAELPFVGSLFGSLKALFKQESEYRTEVKQVLRKYPGTLLQSVNELLDAARGLLGQRDLLVIVDNLDRYEPEVIDRLLVQGADRMRELRTNLVLTPPISLLLQPKSAQLDTLYSCHVLYTVRLRRQDQDYGVFDGPGRDLMEQALALRMDLDSVIPEREARDRLIAASGGAVRELLDLVSQAAYMAHGAAITRADVERAVASRRQRMRDLINANGWLDALVRLARDKQIFPDKACMDVLFHRLAFKYNGDGWYDVHPLVAEIPEFVNALHDLLR
ncbi:hypothetical protein WME99_08710 [Sorangium sp. So ce136]|uniref:hypothetical protein n=1 Tax=Sorangium sp. So ce136 TaxID=3133284 RepID=UPI003EFFF71A